MTKEEVKFRVWMNKQLKQLKSLSKEEKLYALSALLEFKKRDGRID